MFFENGRKVLFSVNQYNLRGGDLEGWLPVARGACGWLTCPDDVADSPRAQGVIERDHHHRIRVAGKLCDDPLWRHIGLGLGEHRAGRRAIRLLCPGNQGTCSGSY